MKKITASILIILLALTGLTACEPALFKFQKSYIGAFDTVTVITGYAKNNSEFEKIAAEIYSELCEYGKLYDIYTDYEGINNLKTVNDNAGKAPVEVDERILDLAEYCIPVYELTGGKVNIAMGSVLILWHEARENGLDDPANAKLPDEKALLKASEHTDINNIVIDREKKTIYLADPQMSLDVGAVAKGYAAEKVAEHFDDRFTGTISVGGNVRTCGVNPNGEDWTVGIMDADDAEKLYCKVQVDGGYSVVTSGDYERYYTVDGVNYCHIIDPETIFPASKYKSVTVVCKNSALADTLSTALFILDKEDGKEILSGLEDVKVFWMDKDGVKDYYGGFENE